MACKAAGIARQDALLAWLQQFVTSQVSVAVRLIPLGQSKGLEVLRDLIPTIASVADAPHARASTISAVHDRRRDRCHETRNANDEDLPHMTVSPNGPLRVGIGGPVGSGKTTLTEMLCKAMRGDYSLAVVTNDIYTKEDALILSRLQALPESASWGSRPAAARTPPSAKMPRSIFKPSPK